MKTNSYRNKALIAGTLMLLLVATASLTPSLAQQPPGEEQTRTQQNAKTLAFGIGAAVDADEDTIYRSHFKFGLVKSTSDSEDSDYEVRRGVVVINDEGSPVRYQAIPDTWNVEVDDNNDEFTADGKVEDSDGNIFDVSMNGESLRKTEHGSLYAVKGKFNGGDLDYELYYIAGVVQRAADRTD
jgi:hypothetical protein